MIFLNVFSYSFTSFLAPVRFLYIYVSPLSRLPLPRHLPAAYIFPLYAFLYLLLTLCPHPPLPLVYSLVGRTSALSISLVSVARQSALLGVLFLLRLLGFQIVASSLSRPLGC